MTNIDIVKSVVLGSGNPDKAALYADDFRWSDSTGSPPMDKNSWLALEPMVLASFPDMKFVTEDIRDEGGGVRVAGHFVGTFTNDLDVSAMGMGVIPANGKKITFPTTSDLITVEGGKITKWHGLDTGPDAGMAGFIKTVAAS